MSGGVWRRARGPADTARDITGSGTYMELQVTSGARLMRAQRLRPL